MKKDIPIHKVQDIAIVIVPREKHEDDPIELWDTYLINFKDESIKNILINSHGYGERNGNKIKTSTLRHFFDEIGPLSTVKIEPIQTTLFDLTHEYWVSFQYNNFMYDKKYVFVKGSLHEINFTDIPFISQKGVMIR